MTSAVIDRLQQNAAILAKEGKRRAAVVCLRRAITIENRSAPLHVSLGMLLYQTGEFAWGALRPLMDHLLKAYQDNQVARHQCPISSMSLYPK